MKFFIIAMIFIVIVGVGVFIKLRYAKKEKFFKDAYLFCDVLKPNIVFMHMPIKKIIDKNEENFSKEFKEVLQNYLSNIDDLKEFEINYGFLKRSETENICNLLKNVGKTDSISQQNLIENSKIMIGQELEAAAKENKKFGMVSLKVCICFGIMAVILLI